MPKSAEPEPEVSDHESSGEESEEEGPCLKLQDIGTFAAQGGEITMKMQPVKAKKAKKVKKKKKKEEKEEDCTCEKNENCPDLSHNEDLPDADLDTILDRYAALFTQARRTRQPAVLAAMPAGARRGGNPGVCSQRAAQE